ncbi:MAG TPA: hypothetical protein V6C97_21995 [Oculatellaceae cyanobacterium]
MWEDVCIEREGPTETMIRKAIQTLLLSHQQRTAHTRLHTCTHTLFTKLKKKKKTHTHTTSQPAQHNTTYHHNNNNNPSQPQNTTYINAYDSKAQQNTAQTQQRSKGGVQMPTDRQRERERSAQIERERVQSDG